MKELNKGMYYKAKPEIFDTARILRKNMTNSEKLLWERLKGKQICGLRFRRQHPIDMFIVDFYCHEVRLVLEIDGEIHNMQKEYDGARTAEIERYGVKVMRFKNVEIERDIDNVVKKIEAFVAECLQVPLQGF